MTRPRVRFHPLFAVALLAGAAVAFAQGMPPPEATLPLHAGWQLRSSCETQASDAEISWSGFQATGWHAASVPSTVLAALVADGVYPNPDYGLNVRKIPRTDHPIGANFANMPMPKDSPFTCP